MVRVNNYNFNVFFTYWLIFLPSILSYFLSFLIQIWDLILYV